LARLIAVAALALAAGLAPACSDDGSPEIESITPRITADAAAEDEIDRDLLLREQDVTAQPGFEEVRATDLDEAPIFENPDPRGPCGGPVPPLDFEGTIGRTFLSSTTNVGEFIGPDDDDARAYHADLAADIRPSCEGFESETDTGDTQRVTAIEVLDLGLGDAGVGWYAQYETEGALGFGGAISILAEGRAAFVQVLARRPFDPEIMVALAQLAAERLGLEGS
jgi:hypothetical protein